MSALVLKLIAAFTMALDHAGLILFGNALWMRAVGRLAFPLYAFFIAEGFRFTKNRLRYFLSVFLLGVGCQIVCAIASPGEVLGVLITFSLSMLLMESVRRAKEDRRYRLLCLAAFPAAALFCRFFPVDYGFAGVLLPLLPSLFQKRWARLSAFAGGLVLLCLQSSSVQWFSLLVLPLLLLYNGQRGRYKMKYFFYVFYPLHLAILWGIAYLI